MILNVNINHKKFYNPGLSAFAKMRGRFVCSAKNYYWKRKRINSYKT